MTRRSKRELERALDDLETEGPDVAGLITILSADEVEAVPDRPALVRVDGEVKRLSPSVRERFGGSDS